jgi:hypothetical protein
MLKTTIRGDSLSPLPFTSAELLAAFAWWLRDGGSDARGILNRLHLPGTRRRVLNVLRDRQLVEAARLILPDGNRYAQAVALRQACQAFEGHLWHAWKYLPCPPVYADVAQQALFWAFRFDESSIRENRPHTPADWSLSAFRKLLPNPSKECRAAA